MCKDCDKDKEEDIDSPQLCAHPRALTWKRGCLGRFSRSASADPEQRVHRSQIAQRTQHIAHSTRAHSTQVTVSTQNTTCSTQQIAHSTKAHIATYSTQHTAPEHTVHSSQIAHRTQHITHSKQHTAPWHTGLTGQEGRGGNTAALNLCLENSQQQFRQQRSALKSVFV